jgi:hypothetical protein
MSYDVAAGVDIPNVQKIVRDDLPGGELARTAIHALHDERGYPLSGNGYLFLSRLKALGPFNPAHGNPLAVRRFHEPPVGKRKRSLDGASRLRASTDGANDPRRR